MISWIKGEPIDLWQTGNKFFILINCHGLGYEIQILESIFIKLKTKQLPENKVTLWLKHIKKEDSDSLFGFISKDQKIFFNKVLNIKGAGSQIGMSLLNNNSVDEIKNAINKNDKKLISSVPGIGPKMTERIILELRSNLKIELSTSNESKNDDLQIKDIEVRSILEDIELTLLSLNYPKNEIKRIFPILITDIKDKERKQKRISFEILLKLAMNHLDKNISNIDR